MNDRKKTVRLPKAAEQPEGIEQLEVLAEGSACTNPKKVESWDAWFQGPTVSDDFMVEREQPDHQVREGF